MDQADEASSWSQDDLPLDLWVTTHANRAELGYPGLMVQATRAECGGVVLVVWMDHALHDAPSYFHFLQAWATTCAHMQRTGQLPPHSAPPFDLPLHDRALFDAALASSGTAVGDEQGGGSSSFNATPPPLRQPSRSTVIHFTPAHLRTVKAKLTEALQLLPQEDRPPFVSTHDALLAHLWSLLNEARQVPPSALSSVLMQALSARERLSPPLPATYSGSVWIPCTSRVPTSAASEQSPRSALHFAQRGAAVRGRVNQLSDPSYLASLLSAWSAVEPIQLSLPLRFGDPVGLITTSWTPFPVYEADFGWGRPQSMSYHLPLSVGNLFAVLPSPTRKGLDVWVAQTVESYQRMVQRGRIYDFGYE